MQSFRQCRDSLGSCIILVLLTVSTISTVSFAKEPTNRAKTETFFVPGERHGWYGTTKLGATLSLSDHESVVGKQDGLSVSMGYKFDAAFGYEASSQAWRNRVTLAQGLTRTPSVESFIKSQDELHLQSTYLYRVLPWFGPLVQVSADMPVLTGADVRSGPTTYVITRVDGSTERITASRLPLTEMFQPLVLKQSIGPYARPLDLKSFNLQVRLGYAGRQTLADEQLALDDNDKTDQVEVKELQTRLQSGPDAGLVLWGSLISGALSYRMSGELMLPLTTEPPPDVVLSVGDRLNVDVRSEISLKLAKFASFDYRLNVSRNPQVLDKTQVTHLTTLTFGVALGQGPKARP